MLRVGVSKVAVSSANEFTLQVVDVALAIEQVLLIVTFNLNALEASSCQVFWVININHIFIIFVLSLSWLKLVGHVLILFLLLAQSIGVHLLLIEEIVGALIVFLCVAGEQVRVGSVNATIVEVNSRQKLLLLLV